MIVGFTGSRHGMTPHQVSAVRAMLSACIGGEFHHGDCVGADAEAAGLAQRAGYRIICHPPTDNQHRAHFNSDETRPPLPHLKRNELIVGSATIMIATPGAAEADAPRSGTWYTIRYARKRGIPVWVFMPDGSRATIPESASPV